MPLTSLAAATGAPDSLGLVAGAGRVLDARLERGENAPVAVAFSGGGDSLALLLLTRRWAENAGRRLMALTVDHRLQPASADWAAWCARRASQLRIDHRILAWNGPKPTSGVASAARDARHRLIAGAAREAGARVILMGHTADDVVEAALMRAAGLRVSAPRAWSPSPVWPDGRGLYILRPLLDARRAAIRAWLAAAGETWIDDPANADPRQPRARARGRLAREGPLSPPMCEGGDLTALFQACRFGPAGEATVARAEAAGAAEAARFLAAAVVCVAGTERPPRGPAVERLMARLRQGGDFSATLAGSGIVARGELLTIARETTDQRARPAPRLALEPGQTGVYDGRFEVAAREAGLCLRPLAGLATRLDNDTQRRLASVAPMARPGLPVLIDAAGRATCPTLTVDSRADLRCLVAGRLAGACGVVRRERDIERA